MQIFRDEFDCELDVKTDEDESRPMTRKELKDRVMKVVSRINKSYLLSYRIVLYRIVSYRIVLYRIVSYSNYRLPGRGFGRPIMATMIVRSPFSMVLRFSRKIYFLAIFFACTACAEIAVLSMWK